MHVYGPIIHHIKMNKLILRRISHIDHVLWSIGYLHNCIYPDLSFVTTFRSRFVENQGVNHLNLALERVLRYLKYPRNMTLTSTSYSKPQKLNIEVWLYTPLHGWTNANWGGGTGYTINDKTLFMKIKTK